MSCQHPLYAGPSHWKPIPGMEGYEVSSLGCVRRNGRPAKIGYNQSGYARFCGKRDGYAANVQQVNHVMALAFHGPAPYPISYSAHWDGSRTSNFLENIRWATPSENAADCARHGRHSNGEKSPKAKLTEAQAREILRRFKDEGPVKLGREFGVNYRTVSEIGHRRQWKHLDAADV